MEVGVLNKKICKLFKNLDDEKYSETTEDIESWLDTANTL